MGIPTFIAHRRGAATRRRPSSRPTTPNATARRRVPRADGRRREAVATRSWEQGSRVAHHAKPPRPGRRALRRRNRRGAGAEARPPRVTKPPTRTEVDPPGCGCTSGGLLQDAEPPPRCDAARGDPWSPTGTPPRSSGEGTRPASLQVATTPPQWSAIRRDSPAASRPRSARRSPWSRGRTSPRRLFQAPEPVAPHALHGSTRAPPPRVRPSGRRPCAARQPRPTTDAEPRQRRSNAPSTPAAG